MIQGESSSRLRELVEAQGGTVTHDLRVIHAVGAMLPPSQLESIRNAPEVTRVIDDLSTSADPAPESGGGDDGCNVGGSLELEFDHRGINWPIYNKTAQAAHVEKLEASWPASLGTATGVSIAGRKLDPARLVSPAGGPLEVEFSTADAPRLKDVVDLRIEFAEPGAEPDLQQKDFELRVAFAEDCETKLVPGYKDNHTDFYYPTVVGADSLQKLGVTGKGVTVAVLDSGLWEHQHLANDTAGKPRILARYDAINDRDDQGVFDESGHGTHMTSVIAHSGPVERNGESTGSFKGVAPDVNLVAIRAFDREGQGDFLDIVRGVQWVIDNREKYGIRVLNLSFAARPRWPYWQDPINQAVMRAWASGITVVAAAGNEGPEPMTIGSPGNLPYVITVGATTDSWTVDTRDDDYIPDFSSRGPTPTAHIKPDIVAPGGHITGITRPGSSLTREHPDYILGTGEFVMTGSSQAAALVSGIVALLLQLEPDLEPNDVKCKLLSSAEPAIQRDGLLAYSPFEQGHGLVNATRAVTLGKAGCGNPGMDVNREINSNEFSEGPAIVNEDGTPGLPGLDAMLSPLPSEKGMSVSRKWGVKDHIERETKGDLSPDEQETKPFDWMEVYLLEKSIIEGMRVN